MSPSKSTAQEGQLRSNDAKLLSVRNALRGAEGPDHDCPPFELSTFSSGYVCLGNGRVKFVRFRPSWQWEFYLIVQKVRDRGLEMFARYLNDTEAARLEAAISAELEQRRTPTNAIQPDPRVRGYCTDIATGRWIR